jgi:hypothetical protein
MMTPFEELSTILERIEKGQVTDADVATLRQLVAGDRQRTLQLGKYNVNIGQGQNIQIGDRIYQGADAKAIQSMLETVLEKRLVDQTSSEDDIALNIAISNAYTKDAARGRGLLQEVPERTLTYQMKRTAQQLQITPKMDYLLGLATGKPIFTSKKPLDRPPYFKWQFPNLDLRIVNNSRKTIFITDVIFEVETSTPNSYPVLILPENQTKLFGLDLYNEGWGEMRDVVIQFNLVPLGQSFFSNENYQHTIQIDHFADKYLVDVSDSLRTIGVDVECLSHADLGKADKSAVPDALGPFRNSKQENSSQYWAVAYGEIAFTGQTFEGFPQANSIKFAAEILLLNSVLSLAAPAYVSYQYGVCLETERQHYQVVAQENGESVSQYLKPGEVDRFNIRVGGIQSSHHTFRLRLVYNNEQTLLSPPISLNLFVPRSEAKNIKQASALRI